LYKEFFFLEIDPETKNWNLRIVLGNERYAHTLLLPMFRNSKC